VFEIFVAFQKKFRFALHACFSIICDAIDKGCYTLELSFSTDAVPLLSWNDLRARDRQITGRMPSSHCVY